MTLIDRALFKFTKANLSYSQCGEDRILRFVLGDEPIRYLDIGANHPKMTSNTYLFYRNGSNGVCVEPNPALCDVFRKARPRDEVVNCGVGVEEGSADFYVLDPHTLSTFSESESGNGKIVEKVRMPLRTINSFGNGFDLVSIDVEGWNEELVRSIDFETLRPKAFIIETKDWDGRRLTGIFEHMAANGYKVYADTYLNTIFVPDEFHF